MLMRFANKLLSSVEVSIPLLTAPFTSIHMVFLRKLIITGSHLHPSCPLPFSFTQCIFKKMKKSLKLQPCICYEIYIYIYSSPQPTFKGHIWNHYHYHNLNQEAPLQWFHLHHLRCSQKGPRNWASTWKFSAAAGRPVLWWGFKIMQGPCASFCMVSFWKTGGKMFLFVTWFWRLAKMIQKQTNWKAYGTREHKLRVLVVRSYSRKVTNKRRD